MRTKGSILMAALCVVALLAVSGCSKDPGMTSGDLNQKGQSAQPSGGTGGTTTPPSTSGSQGSSTASLNLGPFKLGETANFAGLQYTLKEITTASEGPNLGKGEIFLYAHFLIKNGTKQTWLINSLNGFKLIDPAGKRFSKSMFGDNVKGQTMDINLLPEKTHDGWIAFTPKDQKGEFQIEIAPVSGGKAIFTFTV